jgi:predicted 3-demethylubiquinone-9 3-methyltransferase (glyoxalase superfamily)
MNKFLTAAAIGVLIAAAGCSKAANSDGPVKREAGNWKTDVKLVKFEVPGMPAEMKDGMAKMMEGASGMDQCFTQEQVDKEDIASELAKGPGNGGECKWSKKDIAGGKIDIAGTCTANGQTVDMAMNGTMEAKKSDVTITTKGKVPTGGDMEMVMQMTSTHTGPCKAPAAT